jgi:hypothetical protein
MVDYELSYYDARGLAEPIRYILALAEKKHGITWKDERTPITQFPTQLPPDWKARKLNHIDNRNQKLQNPCEKSEAFFSKTQNLCQNLELFLSNRYENLQNSPAFSQKPKIHAKISSFFSKPESSCKNL